MREIKVTEPGIARSDWAGYFMYDNDAINAALTGLIGFRDNDTDEPIDPPLTQSRSGLYLDGAHPLITKAILSGALELPEVADDAPESALSVKLTQVLADATTAVLSALRTRKLLRYETGNVLATTVLYEGEGPLYDLIQPAGRFVGLRIVMSDPTLAVPLSSVGLQFTGPVTDFLIHVLETGQTTLVSLDKAGRMVWADMNIVLRGRTSYTVGYYEADLPDGVQAVRRAKAIVAPTCPGCDPANFRIAARWSPFLSVDAVRIDNPGDTPDVMPDQNFGINLTFSIGCDLTDVLTRSQMQLAPVIQQQAVVMLLKEIAYTPVISTKEQQTKQNAMFALQNGEESKLETLLDALDIDLSGLSANCLPDTRSGQRVRKTTVWGR